MEQLKLFCEESIRNCGTAALLGVPPTACIRSVEDAETLYYQPEEHLRLIFRNGGYAGFYDPALESVI